MLASPLMEGLPGWQVLECLRAKTETEAKREFWRRYMAQTVCILALFGGAKDVKSYDDLLEQASRASAANKRESIREAHENAATVFASLENARRQVR